jgi:hypothetical protein
MKNIFYQYSLIIIILLTSCSNSSTTTTEQHISVLPPESSQELNWQADFSDAQVLLVSDAEENNFKKLVSTELQSVFSSSELSDDITYPLVESFVQGPNHELILVLKQTLVMGADNCVALYYQSSSSPPECLVNNSFELSGNPQIDLNGKVCYYGQDLVTDIFKLICWQPTINTKENLINGYTELTKWGLHPQGDIYLLGLENSYEFFRRINQGGDSLDNIVLESHSVTDFIFVDQTHLIYQSNDGLYLLTLSGSEEGESEQLLLQSGDLSSAQIDSEGRVYISSGNQLYSIYPNQAYEVYLDLYLNQISSFQIIDDEFYIVGYEETQPIYYKVSLNEQRSTMDLLQGQSISVYSVTYSDDIAYAYGLNQTSNDEIFAKFDLENQFVQTLDALNLSFSQVECLNQSAQEYQSYTNINNLEETSSDDFLIEEVSIPDDFIGLNDTASLTQLTGDDSNYLAVVDHHYFYILDASSVDDLNITSTETLCGGSGGGYYIDAQYIDHEMYFTTCADVLHMMKMDLSDLDSPILEDGLSEDHYSGFNEFRIIDNVLYVLDYNRYIRAYDYNIDESLIIGFTISDSTEEYSFLTYFDSIDTIHSSEQGSILYIVGKKANQTYLYTFDVSNTDDVLLLDQESLDGNGYKINTFGSYVYAVSDEGDFYIINASENSNLRVESQIQILLQDTANQTYETIELEYENGYVFIAFLNQTASLSYFYIYDVANLKVVQSFSSTNEFTDFEALERDDGFSLYAVGGGGIYQYQITPNSEAITGTNTYFVTDPVDCGEEAAVWYKDADEDGYGDSSLYITACEQPTGYVDDATDCNDSDAEIHPLMLWYEDADSDGYGNGYLSYILGCETYAGFVPNDYDCNDEDAGINPENTNVFDTGCEDEQSIWALGDIADVKVTSDIEDDYAGYSISSSKDVNGDGHIDLLIGAYGDDTNGTNSGASYLFYGPFDSEINLEDADAIFKGENEQDRFGYSVALVDDVNGDGISDILIGAYYEDVYESNDGAVYLYHGSSTLTGEVELSDADVKFHGEDAGSYAGVFISSGGDLNNDGYGDLLFVNGYSVNLVFGSASLPSEYNLENADVIFLDDSTDGHPFKSAVNAGDVNADGYDDILVGSPYDNDGGDGNYGAAYIFLGPMGSSSEVGSSIADAKLLGEESGMQAGLYLSSAGDMNADGYDDVIIGCAFGIEGYEGRIYIVNGPISGEFDLGDADTIFEGENEDSYAGRAVSNTGDVNNDGYDDILINAQGEDRDGEEDKYTYLILGPADEGTVNLSDADVLFIGGGWSLSFAGDINFDGYDDFIIGPGYGDEVLSIIYGREITE